MPVTSIAGNYTVDNLGTIASSDSAAIRFEQTIADNEASGLIISNSNGVITFDQGSIDNSGTIEAETGGALTFNATSVSNKSGALIISADGGILTFNQGSLDNFGTVNANAGTLSFQLTALTNEIGGLIEAENGGTLRIDETGNLVTNAGTIAAQNGGTVLLESATVANTGSLELNSTGSAATIEIGMVTLDGGGSVLLSDSSENFIVSDGSPAQLTNVDNTISGAGMDRGHGGCFLYADQRARRRDRRDRYQCPGYQ